MEYSYVITGEMYKLGYRNDKMNTILFNPFYHAGFDRAKATQYVQMFHEPVIRLSSIPNLFSITYENSDSVINHVLLRQNVDLSIDEMCNSNTVVTHYNTIHDILEQILRLKPYDQVDDCA
jgi:hypothetical protein